MRTRIRAPGGSSAKNRLVDTKVGKTFSLRGYHRSFHAEGLTMRWSEPPPAARLRLS